MIQMRFDLQHGLLAAVALVCSVPFYGEALRRYTTVGLDRSAKTCDIWMFAVIVPLEQNNNKQTK